MKEQKIKKLSLKKEVIKDLKRVNTSKPELQTKYPPTTETVCSGGFSCSDAV